MPKIAIGIPTYNGARRLDWLLQSIKLRTDFSKGDVQIIVIDDGSPRVHETRIVADKYKGSLPLTYLEHGTNKGISAGWNAASRATDAPYVTLINDDVIVARDWLLPIIHVLEHSPQVGGVGVNWHAFLPEDVTKLLENKNSDMYVIPRDPVSKVPTPARRDLEPCNPGRVMCPTGQLFAFRRSDFDDIGGFDEGYTSFYEESCFGTSMAAKQKKIGVQLNHPMCWHLWSATFRENPELNAESRIGNSRQRYRTKWAVPDGVHEFEYTNPKYLGAIGDVPVQWVRFKTGEIANGILRQDGAYIDA
jgi:GT2 family glycosyltransferase